MSVYRFPTQGTNNCCPYFHQVPHSWPVYLPIRLLSWAAYLVSRLRSGRFVHLTLQPGYTRNPASHYCFGLRNITALRRSPPDVSHPVLYASPNYGFHIIIIPEAQTIATTVLYWWYKNKKARYFRRQVVFCLLYFNTETSRFKCKCIQSDKLASWIQLYLWEWVRGMSFQITNASTVCTAKSKLTKSGGFKDDSRISFIWMENWTGDFCFAFDMVRWAVPWPLPFTLW